MNLILASRSHARKTLLENAGLSFECIPADLDETAIQESGTTPEQIARKLAEAKALCISDQYPDALVIGSDQVLHMDGALFTKADSVEKARTKLLKLKGKSHKLTSAVALAEAGKIRVVFDDTATLRMENFSDEFLETYLNTAGEALTRSVGAYELESLGSWLFNRIEGDYFTILGMPLLPLLGWLRDNKGIVQCINN